MIRLSHVRVQYPDKTVFDDLSLTLPDTGAVALMAPSGYGKTTLLRVLAGLKPIDAGELSFHSLTDLCERLVRIIKEGSAAALGQRSKERGIGQ